MITPSESGLTQAEYDAIDAQDGLLAKRVTLSRRNLAFAVHTAHGTSGGYNFDAFAKNFGLSNYIYRVQTDEDGSLLFWRLPEEDGGDESWVGSITIDTGVSTDVRPSFDDSGDVIYVKDGDIRRAYTSDDGDTWTTEEIVNLTTEGIDGEVTHVAGSGETSCFFAVYQDDFNTRFYKATSSGPPWDVLPSDLYIPHPITGFDAKEVAAGASYSTARHLVSVTMDLPVLVGTKIEGTQEVQVTERRNGFIAFMNVGKRWSEHHVIEQFDDASDYQERKYCFASALDDNGTGANWCVTTYGIDGNANYNHPALHYSFSGDGRFWSHPDLCRVTGEDYGGKLVVLDELAYILTSTHTYRSPSTELVGAAAEAIQEDITERVKSWSSNQSVGRQTSMQLFNEDDWYADSMLADGGSFTVTTEFGTYIAASPVFFQWGHELVTAHGNDRSIPTDRVALKAQDGSILINQQIHSSQAILTDTQVLGADRFVDTSGTGYGGMGHTAPMSGSWRTEDSSLKNVANNKRGTARSTFKVDIWNGSISAAVTLTELDPSNSTTPNWGGLIFRAWDQSNYYSVEWRQAQSSSHIYLMETRAGEEEDVVDIYSTGWSIGETHYIRVVFRYSLVTVFVSDDGKSWSKVIQEVLPGKDFSGGGSFIYDTDPDDADALIEEGSVGFTAMGYSDEDTWSVDPSVGDDDDDTPAPTVPVPGAGGDGYNSPAIWFRNFRRVPTVGDVEYSGIITNTGDLSSGPWADCMNGLPVVDGSRTEEITYGNIDYWDSASGLVFFRNGGMYRNLSWELSGTWVSMVSTAQLTAALEAQYTTDTFTDFTVESVAMSMAAAGTFYITVRWDRAGDDLTTPVQIKGYGTAINVCPYPMALSRHDATPVTPLLIDLSRRTGIAASHAEEEDFIMASGCTLNLPGNKYTGYWNLTWGSWSGNLTADGGVTYLTPTEGWTYAPDQGGGVFIPYYDRNGDVNTPVTEFYLLGVDQSVLWTINAGASFQEFTENGHNPATDLYWGWKNGPDHFETYGQHTGAVCAFLEYDEAQVDTEHSLYVLEEWADSDDESLWKRVELKGNPGWMGGWPYTGGQFYVGYGSDEHRVYTDDTVLLEMTQDAADTWIDLTHNVKSLLSWTLYSATSTAQETQTVRMTPDWGGG